MKSRAGFTLVEVIVVAAVSVIIFGALFFSFEYSIKLIANTRAKLGAISLANDRMEYIRSLPYNDVGTIAGIPPGNIPQNSTTTLNGVTFNERVLIEYVDDPADGQLTATTTDDNNIATDYKRVKIEISWTIYNNSDSISLISNIIPRSIESTVGGGTVRVNVLNADSTPLPGAEVNLINNTTTTTIDVTRFADVNGIALFSGAPAASNYEVIVTAPGYSTDQTYQATTSNPYPITAPFSVLEADISTVTFQIGELSDIFVTTYSDVTEGSYEETFSDTSGLLISNDTAVYSGGLQLANVSNGTNFLATGYAMLNPISPTTLERWESLSAAASLPAGTEYRISFYTGTSSSSIIPDSDLPGNSAGLTGPVIDLSTLDAVTYPTLYVRVDLETSDDTETPRLLEMTVYYRESSVRRPNVSFSMRGTKIIGADLDLKPIYKVSITSATGGTGESTLNDVEFDTYTFTTSGYDVASVCPSMPFQHQAGLDTNLEFILVPDSTHSYRVSVTATGGLPVPGADVTLSRIGFSETVVTNSCGQVYFASVSEETDYEMTVSKPGFSPVSLDTISISGDTTGSVTLTTS